MANISDDDFINDPLFSKLREFASQGEEPQAMPFKLWKALQDGQLLHKRRRIMWRGIFGITFTLIAVPAFAAANLLPHPIQNFVEHVNGVLTAPLHAITNSGNRPQINTADFESQPATDDDFADEAWANGEDSQALQLPDPSASQSMTADDQGENSQDAIDSGDQEDNNSSESSDD